MEGLSVKTLLGLVNFSIGFSMGNPLVIVFIATEMNATHIKHCSHPVHMYATKKSRTTAIEVQEIYEIFFSVSFC
jgi:uncharacterized membrane protein (UPF0127 family)